jgi:hypothetical protein
MIKGLLIYINIIFLSAISFFSAADITLSSSVPTTAKAGESFEIALTVNKGDLKDFAKIQYNIPTGATATAIDVKGGDFKVTNDMVKITWMGMPAEATFTVKFKVTTTKETTGTIPLTGKFSYISNGEPKDVFFNQNNITFGGSAAATTPAAATTNTTTTTTATNTNPTATTPANTATTATNSDTKPATTTNTTAASTGTVSAKRVLSSTTVKNGESFTVEITVTKNDVTGYAKIQDNLPAGFTAEEIDSYGGQFSIEDGKAKILWMTIPADKVFKVKYKVNVDNTVKGKQKIEGFFSYLPDQTSDTKINIGVSEITVSNEATVATTAPVKTETTPANTNTTKSADKTETSTAPAKTETVKVIEKEKPSTTSTTANTTKPKVKKENSVAVSQTPAVINNPGATNNNQQLYYSVQICALKRAVDVSYFEKNHAVTQKVYVQMHEGWHKYTIGEFSVYKEARDYRETVKATNKIVGPFVTAYNKGVRITVQEALMISGQQWVQ